MQKIVIHISDNKMAHFIELMKSLTYVERIETESEPSKDRLIRELKEAIEELKEIEKGNLKARPAKAFLDEL